MCDMGALHASPSVHLRLLVCLIPMHLTGDSIHLHTVVHANKMCQFVAESDVECGKVLVQQSLSVSVQRLVSSKPAAHSFTLSLIGLR